jgi:hypothetical protein
MVLNGLYALAWAALIVAAVIMIPRAVRHDRIMATLERLDDDELTAVLEEFPDILDRARKW